MSSYVEKNFSHTPNQSDFKTFKIYWYSLFTTSPFIHMYRGMICTLVRSKRLDICWKDFNISRTIYIQLFRILQNKIQTRKVSSENENESHHNRENGDSRCNTRRLAALELVSVVRNRDVFGIRSALLVTSPELRLQSQTKPFRSSNKKQY